MSSATSDNEWQRMTTSHNEWQRMVQQMKANKSHFRFQNETTNNYAMQNYNIFSNVFLKL